MMKSYCSSHCVEQTRSFHHEGDFPAQTHSSYHSTLPLNPYFQRLCLDC